MVEEELGSIVLRNSSVFPDESRETMIGKWIAKEKNKLLDSIGITEHGFRTKADFDKASDALLYAVCSRCLRRAQANRKSGVPSPTYTQLIEYYNLTSNDYAMQLTTKYRGFAVLRPEFYELTISEPGGSESWVRGTTHDITWTNHEDLDYRQIRIELWKGKSFHALIASNVQNIHEYSWTIDDIDLVAGTDYQVKLICVEDTRICSISPSFFTLT